MGSRAFPERVGRYDLLLQLGSGGMASVYLARARGAGGFQRDVALKLVHPHLANDEADGARQLIEEARIAARIRHRNVVAVTDVGEDPVGVFLVMEYVDGEPLSALQRLAAPERIPMPIVLRILDDTLAGLDAAHELCGADGTALGLVHRDVSPQNVLVGLDGTTRLGDFGIAKIIGGSSVTRTLQVKGKPGYMSPEQARGEPLDRRSDVWAAAVMAWELFSGTRMFAQGDDLAKLLKLVTTGAPRLRSVWPDAPSDLDDLLADALASDRASRLPTAEAFRSRLLASNVSHVADPREVAEYVTTIAGARIERRRREAERAALTGNGSPEVTGNASPEEGATVTAVPMMARTVPRRAPWGVAIGIAALVAVTVTLVFARERARSPAPHGEEAVAAPPMASVVSIASAPAPTSASPTSESPAASAITTPAVAAAPAVTTPAVAAAPTTGTRPARRTGVSPRPAAATRPATSAAPSVRPPHLLKDSLDDT